MNRGLKRVRDIIKYQNMNKNSIIFIVITLIVLVVAIFLITPSGGPGKYDALAQCVSDSGAKFYGAWWCSHCAAQKKMFGKSVKLLPYIECYAPGQTKDQLEICVDAKIESYPTWEFADGSRLVKVMSFEELAEKTSCVLPE